MDIVIATVSLVLGAIFWMWFLFGLDRWKWSACTCGRTKLPWFYIRHPKTYLMWSLAIFWGSYAVLLSLFSNKWLSIMFGLIAVWQAKTAWEHGKGKRKWPKRVAGWVRINQHGRLVVES